MPMLSMRARQLFFFFSAALCLTFFALVADLFLSKPSKTYAFSPPTVETVSLTGPSITSGTITLNSETTTNFSITATINDPDGYQQIDSASQYTIKFYRTTLGNACTANKNNCYVASVDQITFAPSSCAGNTCVVQADFSSGNALQYYAHATDASSDYASDSWTASVFVADDDSQTGEGTTTFEMATSVSLDVTPSFSYGTIDLNNTSAQKAVTVTNRGNAIVDANIRGSGNMNCNSGTIAIDKIKYSLTDGFSYASGTALTTSDAGLNLNVPVTTQGADGTANAYFLLQLPPEGVGGDCSNTLTFTAVDS